MLQIPVAKLKEFLTRDGLVASEAFDILLLESERMGQNIAEVLISRGLMTRDYFYRLLATYFDVEQIDLTNRAIDEEVLARLPEEIAREKRVMLFAAEPDGTIDVAMEDPSDLATIDFLTQRLVATVKPFLATPADIDRGFALYGRRTTENFSQIIEENVRMSLRRRAGTIEEAAKDLPIVAIVDTLLSYAVSLRTSDIHIEIFTDTILVRFRIDGILHEIIRIAKEAHPAIVARIKLLAGLKIDEHMKPQDGRFRYKMGADMLDVRVSVIPTFYGEKIEMRLLASTQKPLSLEELGFLEDTRRIVEANIRKTYGMILITGPTGSGKTTTLYSILSMLNKPEVNIVTIEDPIEYDMRFVNQTQINPQAGITFASGLRSILRQDPNVIMVGEIRDEETAEISVHAALTGHLVVSSLHTNDAPTAVPRLLDMKIPPFLVAAVLNVVIAQRLVRKICMSCIESFTPEPDVVQFLERELKSVNVHSHVKAPKSFYRGRGCAACGSTGFRGRFGIFEVLEINEALRRLVAATDFSLDALADTAKQTGMITMFEDGVRKVEAGMTTIEEVLRVIRE